MSEIVFTDGEISRYGTHFLHESEKLIGASEVVDVAAVRGRVQATLAAFEAERLKADLARGDVRSGRKSTEEATEAARDVLDRFFHFVRSRPKTAGIDVEAFFEGKVLGNISELKPADLETKVDTVLRGFGVPANTGLPALDPWKDELTIARDDLAAGLRDRGSARGNSITSTAALDAARKAFARTYNGVAKHLVHGLLNDLERGEEYRLFFLDLQESAPRRTKAKAPPAAPAPDGDTPS
ncbi:MAG: hypothetical protein QM820_15090 [Minicystis sp.]